jgi:hypothetical protein
MSHIPYTKGSVEKTIVHDAIEATVLIGDAVAQIVAGAESIAISLTEAGTVNNRSGAMVVYVSVDGGSNYVVLNSLIDNLANTNSQTLTRIASKTRNAAGTDILFVDPAMVGSITHIKVQLTITDGAAPTGNFTVAVSAKY